jgi:hypothetical protein
MPAITLAEYAKTVQDPLRRGIIETSYEDEPLYGIIPFRNIAGLALPYNQEESLPAVAFRNINEAFTQTHGVVNQKVEVVRPFGGESDTDEVLVDAYGMGERTSRDKMFSKSMSVKYIQTLFYGNSGARNPAFTDPKGFDGIEARITAGQTVDGLGTGASDGSSVFALRFGDGYVQGLQTPKGLDVKDLGVIESTPAYRTRIQHTAGLAIFHGKAVGWIKDLRPTTQVLTVSLMNQLRDKIVGTPDVYVMSKRSRNQLFESAIGAGTALGMTIDALGRPVEGWGGVPIYVSDAILDTETMP